MDHQSFITGIPSLLDIIGTEVEKHIDEVGSCGDNVNKRVQLNSEFISVVKNNTISVYRLLNYSVLSAEFIFDKNVEQTLKSLSEQIDLILEAMPEKGFDQESENLLSALMSLKNDLALYSDNISLFWTAVESPQENFINVERRFSKSIGDTISIPISKYSDVFRNNLNLLQLDARFGLSGSVFYALNKICHKALELKRFVPEGYIDAIAYKCRFLEHKFMYKEDNFSQKNCKNFYNGKKEDALSVLSLDDVQTNRVKELYTKHVEEYKQSVSKYFSQIKGEPECTFDFFVACHYYKNVVCNEELLSELIKKFSDFANQHSSRFDKANRSACENYLNNCRLSFLVKEDTMNYSEIKNELAAITSNQSKSHFIDYFPYLKVAQWECSHLRSEKGPFSLKKKILEDAKTNIDKADRVLRETRHFEGCYMPFKPFFDDCILIIEVKDKILTENKLRLFCYTSFVVPVDYDKEELLVENLRYEHAELYADINSRAAIEDVVTDINWQNEKQKEDVKADLKDNQKSIIEILSIFAAIVIFASGSIQILSNSADVIMAGKFMLLFSAGLGVMGVLLSCIFRSSEKWNRRDVICLVFCSVILGLSCISLFGCKQEHKPTHNVIESNINEDYRFLKLEDSAIFDVGLTSIEEGIDSADMKRSIGRVQDTCK